LPQKELWIDVALKVLIVPDKFKGTLTAQQAGQAIADGWRQARSNDELEILPMSDGGDGFGEVISSLLQARLMKAKAVDAAHRPCDAAWWWHAQSKTAIIESARVIGLALLPSGKYHPFELDTEGLAAVLQGALQNGARRCLIGIGGSATNDAGFGIARGLGWQFFGLHDEKITRWTELRDLALIKRPDPGPWFEEISVAVDVQNPLLGPQGCTRVYGPQKGLKPDDFEFAEASLAQLADVVEKQLHFKYADDPGAGAAGGLGYGLRCFAQATLQPGFDLFARHANLEERLASADLVITGEGAIDDSTRMGKGVGQIAAGANRLGLPCVGVAGAVTGKPPEAFQRVYATADLAGLADAMARPAHWVAVAATKAAREWR
jgi:glycerate kinase